MFEGSRARPPPHRGYRTKSGKSKEEGVRHLIFIISWDPKMGSVIPEPGLPSGRNYAKYELDTLLPCRLFDS